MSPESIEQALAGMDYERDARRAPDERRRVRFRVGWEDAAKRGAIYADASLKRLTWNNLGYRFGTQYGLQSSEQIDAAFDVLAELWHRVRGPSSETKASLAPSPEQYVAAFRKIGNVSESQLQMLQLHYYATARTITASQMAQAIGYAHYTIANSQYGRLGRLLGDQLEYNPMKERLGTLVTFENRQGEWHWLMRPEVAQALEILGWVERNPLLLAEEVTVPTALVEGAVYRVAVNAYERNPVARCKCIAHYGSTCTVCGFNFGAVYGPLAKGFIHVHHLKPLAEIGKQYEVDPIKDLRPVCANCHAIIHLGGVCRSIEEARRLVDPRVLNFWASFRESLLDPFPSRHCPGH